MPFAELGEGKFSDLIVVATKWFEKELIKQVPGSGFNSKLSQWTVPLTYTSGVILRGVFGNDLTLGPRLIKWMWAERANRVDPAMRLRNLLVPGNFHDPDLFPFQQACVEFMLAAKPGLIGADMGCVEFTLSARAGLIGDDMGCGKTIELLTFLDYVDQHDNSAYPALVICPNSVTYHWAERATEWTQRAVPIVLSGSLGNRRKLLQQARETPNALVIINIESVRSFSRLAPYGDIRLARCAICDKVEGNPILTQARCETHRKELNDFGFKTVFLDEAHRIKDPRAKQTRAVWAVMHDPSIINRWAATGTVIANHVGDLWSVMHAVAKDEYPTKSKFVDRYGLAQWNEFGGLDIVGLRPDTSDEFHRFFQPRFRRMQKAIVLPQLPQKLYSTRVVDMTPAQRKMYEQLETSLMARAPSGELLLARTQLAAITRLSQLSCATVDVIERPDPDDISTWRFGLREPSSKLDELELILEELGDQQSVIAADHAQLIELASKRLTKAGISHLTITGDVAPIDRQQALKALREKSIRTLLFTAKAGGVGLDMSMAPNLIWLQHPWSMIDYKQAEDRVHRIGSERHDAVHIINIVTRNTVEMDKLRRLNEKLRRMDEITQDRAQRLAHQLDTRQLDNEEQQIMNAFLGER